MLNIRLELEDIDHVKCVETLLPQLVEHCAAKPAPNELDRLLAGLGREAVPAARELLAGVSVDEKDRLTVWLAAAHEERMRSSANRHLAELLGAPIVRIGRFAAVDRPGSGLALLASGVETDYRALLESPLVGDGIEHIGERSGVLKSAAKLAVQMGRVLPADALEKQGVNLLNSPRVKTRFLAALQDGVRQAGLAATIRDAVAERTDAVPDAPAADAAAARAFLTALSEKAAALRTGA